MKKVCMVSIFLLLVLSYGQVGASIVEIHSADDLLIDIYGFGADIITTENATASDFEISNGPGFPTGSAWQSWIASNPKLGIQAVDYFANAPVGSGLILSIESTYNFLLDNFILADSTGTPYSSDQFKIDVSAVGGTVTYSISNVPLPSALVLLGGGLLGMIGIRRKTMS